MTASLTALTRYLPALITRQLAAHPTPLQQPTAELFDAAVVFVDISGFTALTERLAQRGPAGVEELSRLLNAFFTQLTDLIFAHGGDVVKFAGDAVLALWPGPLPTATHRATQCALAVQATLHHYAAGEGVMLRMRIAIGAGRLAATHIGGTYGRWEFLLSGEPLTQVGLAEAQAQPGEVVLAPEAWPYVQAHCTGEVLPSGAVRLWALTNPLPPQALESVTLPAAAETALWAYLPGAIRARLAAAQSGWLAELRRVTVVFLNLPELDHTTPLDQAQRIMLALQTTLYRYEGSVNKVSIDEKGSTLVAALGLPPLAHEDDAARGVRAAQAMQTALHDLGVRCAIGVTTGRVFCGIVGSDRRCEYTILGDSVNLAARLMQAALHHPTAALLCDAATAEAAHLHFTFTPLPAITVKGKAEPVAIYQPLAETRLPLRRQTALVGRVAEQQQITTQLQALLAGQSSVLLIEGEAGIGKSRLMEALLSQAQLLGLPNLSGAGDAVEKAAPYHAWRGVFAQLFALEVLNTTPEQQRTQVLAQLARTHPDRLELAPLLNAVLPLDLPDNAFTAQLAGEGRANHTRDLLIALLRAPAQAGRLVLILEDAHWLDSNSWALAWGVTQEIQPLLLVLVTRPLPEPWPRDYQRLRQSPATHVLTLTALLPAEIEQLLAHRLGVPALPAAVLTLIRAKAEGHPFFSEELAYALREAGLIQVVEGECRVTPGVNLQTVNFPDTVQGVITSRIDRLTPQQQLALKVASVIGRVFAFRTLHEVYPIEDDKTSLPNDLTALERLDLTPLETPLPNLEYIFKHIITQEVAYNLMTFVQRRQLHLAVVAWYERVFAEDLAAFYPLLAQHWIQIMAGSAADELQPTWVEKAVLYVEKAAEQALHNFANQEAVLLFGTLLEWQQRGWLTVPVAREAHWAHQLGEAQYGLGQPSLARPQFERAVALMGRPVPAHLPGVIADLLAQALQQGWHLLRPPDPAHFKAQRTELLETAMAYGRLGRLYYLVQESLRTLHAFVAGLNWAERAGPSAELALTYAGMCVAASLMNLRGLAERYASRALTLAETQYVGSLPLVAFGVGLYVHNIGDWARAEALLTQAVEGLQRLGDRRGQDESRGLLGLTHFFQGRFVQGRAVFRQMFESGRRGQDPYFQIIGLCGQVEGGLPTTMGLTEARALLEEARVIQPLATTSLEQIRFWGGLGKVCLLQGELGPAHQAALEAFQWIKRTPGVTQIMFASYATAAEACLGVWEYWLNHPEQRAGLPSPQAAAQQVCRAINALPPILPIAQPRVWLLNGVYAWLAGQPRRAQALWQKSLARAQQLHMPYDAGLAHYEMGRHLPPADAARVDHLRRASEFFRQCGADNEVARVAALL